MDGLPVEFPPTGRAACGDSPRIIQHSFYASKKVNIDIHCRRHGLEKLIRLEKEAYARPIH